MRIILIEIYNCLRDNPPKPHEFATPVKHSGYEEIILSLSQDIPNMLAVLDVTVSEFENALQEAVQADDLAEMTAEEVEQVEEAQQSEQAQESEESQKQKDGLMKELVARKETCEEKREEVYRLYSEIQSKAAEVNEEISKYVGKVEEIESEVDREKAKDDIAEIGERGETIKDRFIGAMNDYRSNCKNTESNEQD